MYFELQYSNAIAGYLETHLEKHLDTFQLQTQFCRFTRKCILVT